MALLLHTLRKPLARDRNVSELAGDLEARGRQSLRFMLADLQTELEQGGSHGSIPAPLDDPTQPGQSGTGNTEADLGSPKDPEGNPLPEALSEVEESDEHTFFLPNLLLGIRG